VPLKVDQGEAERGPAPLAVDWKELGEGVMMVSLVHQGRLFKGALTLQQSEVRCRI
jgi:hypothetical protein